MKYIKKGNKYIKNCLGSILLYYNYISPGFKLPKIIDCRISRFFAHKILKFLIITVFFSKLYYLQYKIITINDDFIIKMVGKGEWSNEITLIERGGKLLILKKVKDNEIFEKEKTFYQTYYKNNSDILLPKYKFNDNNIIEMEFIQSKSFERLINEGIISFKQALIFFNLFSKRLLVFYSKNNKKDNLIHGDLGISNIFILSNKYDRVYLIDFSESFKFTYKYDLYVLLKSIFLNFGLIKNTDRVLNDTKVGTVFLEILNVDEKELESIENIFFKRRKEKHPNIYILNP